jgi:prevent-host-death family protein
MSTTTFSSREFNQRASEAKKAASQGPVFITDRGRPAYVLMTIEEYRSPTAPRENIAALLAMPDVGDFELPISPRTGQKVPSSGTG